MSAIKAIVSLGLFFFFLAFTVYAVQNYFEAQKQVEIAQQEVDKATAEYVAANKEFEIEADRLLKEMGIAK